MRLPLVTLKPVALIVAILLIQDVARFAYWPLSGLFHSWDCARFPATSTSKSAIYRWNWCWLCWHRSQGQDSRARRCTQYSSPILFSLFFFFLFFFFFFSFFFFVSGLMMMALFNYPTSVRVLIIAGLKGGGILSIQGGRRNSPGGGRGREGRKCWNISHFEARFNQLVFAVCH